jgi:hypothetical protein
MEESSANVPARRCEGGGKQGHRPCHIFYADESRSWPNVDHSKTTFAAILACEPNASKRRVAACIQIEIGRLLLSTYPGGGVHEFVAHFSKLPVNTPTMPFFFFLKIFNNVMFYCNLLDVETKKDDSVIMKVVQYPNSFLKNLFLTFKKGV